MILLDTSGLLGWLDGGQRQHKEIVRSMDHETPPYLLSPFVLAELDYLLATRVGRRAQQKLLAEVERETPFDSWTSPGARSVRHSP